MRVIQQRDLRNDSGRVLAAVEAGERFTITRNGKPVARLEPIGKRTFVPIAELISTNAAVPKVDYSQWRADLDALIDPEVSGDE